MQWSGAKASASFGSSPCDSYMHAGLRTAWEGKVKYSTNWALDHSNTERSENEEEPWENWGCITHNGEGTNKRDILETKWRKYFKMEGMIMYQMQLRSSIRWMKSDCWHCPVKTIGNFHTIGVVMGTKVWLKWVLERIKRENLKYASLGYSVPGVFLEETSKRAVS